MSQTVLVRVGVSGLTNLYCVPEQDFGSGYEMNSAGNFVAAPAVDPGILLTEHANNKGIYVFTKPAAAWSDGWHNFPVYQMAGGSKNRAVDTLLGLGRVRCESDVFVDSPTLAQMLAGGVALEATLVKLRSFPKNTEFANFMFPMVDANGAAATGLTVTAQRSIDGAAYAACANAVGEVGSGTYKITLAAADLNGDVIMLKFTSATARQVNYEIVTEAT